MAAKELKPARQASPIGNLLYGLSVVFPSWAGAFVLLYVLLSGGLTALNLYLQ